MINNILCVINSSNGKEENCNEGLASQTVSVTRREEEEEKSISEMQMKMKVGLKGKSSFP